MDRKNKRDHSKDPEPLNIKGLTTFRLKKYGRRATLPDDARYHGDVKDSKRKTEL